MFSACVGGGRRNTFAAHTRSKVQLAQFPKSTSMDMVVARQPQPGGIVVPKTREPMTSRPGSILVVATFLAVAAFIAFVVSAALLFPGSPAQHLWKLNEPAHVQFQSMGRVSPALLLLLSAASASACAGLLQGRRWAWWLACGIFAANGFGDAVTLPFTHDLVRSGSGLLVAGAFLFVLLRPSAQAFVSLSQSENGSWRTRSNGSDSHR